MEALRCKTGMKEGQHLQYGGWKSLSPARERIWGSNVKANTHGGYMRSSAPLWVRGQDAFLIISRSQDRSQLATLLVLCKVIWAQRQSFTNVLNKVIILKKVFD